MQHINPKAVDQLEARGGFKALSELPTSVNLQPGHRENMRPVSWLWVDKPQCNPPMITITN